MSREEVFWGTFTSVESPVETLMSHSGLTQTFSFLPTWEGILIWVPLAAEDRSRCCLINGEKKKGSATCGSVERERASVWTLRHRNSSNLATNYVTALTSWAQGQIWKAYDTHVSDVQQAQENARPALLLFSGSGAGMRRGRQERGN